MTAMRVVKRKALNDGMLSRSFCLPTHWILVAGSPSRPGKAHSGSEKGHLLDLTNKDGKHPPLTGMSSTNGRSSSSVSRKFVGASKLASQVTLASIPLNIHASCTACQCSSQSLSDTDPPTSSLASLHLK